MNLRPAVSLLLFFSLLTGGLYPLAVTALAQLLFPHQAHGSLLEHQGRIVGSQLIGQSFVSEAYFHGRPSAAGNGYDASASSGSNLGASHPLLIQRIADAKAAWPQAPAQMLSSSASGLDPHLSPEAARAQLLRIAAARGLDAARLDELITQHTEPRWLGLLGEPVVPVLALNLALDEYKAP